MGPAAIRNQNLTCSQLLGRATRKASAEGREIGTAVRSAFEAPGRGRATVSDRAGPAQFTARWGHRCPTALPDAPLATYNLHPGTRALFPAFALALVLVASVADVAAAPLKKLIEFGWDEPDTAFLRAHITEMEQTPFDGCVFHAGAVGSDGKPLDFPWGAWGQRAFSEAELQPAIRDLQATKFRRFTDNYLRVNVTPGNVDWFDDYSTILNNARLAAHVARAGRCKGLLFDIEQYNSPLFDYRKQRDAQTKSWEIYAAQVRARGREVMTAFQRGFPNLVVFLSHGYCLPWNESAAGKKSLADCRYGLLAPFLDGLFEAARGRARLIDGYEPAYGFKDTSRFERAYRAVHEELLPIVRDPAAYRRRFSLGFGVWMDDNWRKLGWHTDDLTKNFYSPEAFEATVRRGLEVCDEYVWIYTETPRWWTAAGRPEKLPEAYNVAVRRARQGLSKP
jgi:hypothetical protein